MRPTRWAGISPSPTCREPIWPATPRSQRLSGSPPTRGAAPAGQQAEPPGAEPSLDRAGGLDVGAAPEPATPGEGDPGRGDSEPPVVLPASVRGRHIGLALFYPALAALGVLDAARESFSLKAAERFGARAVTLSLFFLYCLGDSTIQAAKQRTTTSIWSL